MKKQKKENNVSGLSLAGMAVQKKHREEKAQQKTNSEDTYEDADLFVKEIKVRNITDLENEIVYTVNENNEVVAARDLYGKMIPLKDLFEF